MANHYLDRIGKSVGPIDILETCDRNGITHAGYGAIYKKFKGAIKSAGKGLRVGCLPNPHTVSVARKMSNLKLGEYVGDYYSINNTLEVPATAKSKRNNRQLTLRPKLNNGAAPTFDAIESTK
jgi:hypothetical protein